MMPFISFGVTIIVVLAAAWYHNRSSQNLINAQNSNADKQRQHDHENKIAEFRHTWLQEVRNTSAELLQSIEACKIHQALVSVLFEQNQNFEHDKFKKELFITWQEKNQTFALHYTKLKLLFKNNDPSTETLLNHLAQFNENIPNLGEQIIWDDDLSKNICDELQVILKTEWEVTKNRDWIKK